VSRVARLCRSAVRRTRRAYRAACARDDAIAHGFTVPDGVWVCDECEAVLLDAADMSRHTARLCL
jgi:hypothetical protein